MYDYGAKYTDKAISQVDKELRRTYRQAQIELRKKLTDFNRRYAAKDKQKRLLLQQGKITEQEYKDWQAGQVFIKSQWESKIRQIDEVMLNHNQQAMKIINEKRLDVFAENYNYSAFIAEKTIATSFDVYNAEAVARLILDNPQLLPEWKIDEEKDYKWNSEKVNNIIRQGIIQGESIDGITDRLCADLATQNENKMRMFARTAMTEAQNAGRQQQMQDSADRGIEVHKQWLATIDSRTRDAHRGLDGQEVPFDEDFDSSLGPIEYPGDPKAAPANVFNCRCTMRSIYPKYRNQMQDEPRIAYRDVVDENGNKRRESYYMTDQAEYLKWKEGKQKNTTENLLNKTTSNGNKTFYSKNATSNHQIVDQLEKDGFIEKGKGSTLEGIDIECAKMIYDCYKRVFERFPFLESWDFAGIETFPLEVKTYADCNPDTGHIRIGFANFSGIELLRANYADDVKKGYHPKGTTEEAIIFHEIGHRIDAILQTEAGFGDRYSKTMLEQCLNSGKIRPWRTFTDDEVFSQISIYAGRDNEEWFAECFATYMTAKEDDMSEMQKAWNILFENAVRRYF
jgi:SPP1 gp7 family putative phage head morphogenesis protein